MLDELKNKIIRVDAEKLLRQARGEGLNVHSIEDFRKQQDRYKQIEKIMDEYQSSFARFSAIGGLTSGIGGFATSMTLAGLDTVSISFQLYRLSEQYAILNGFDGSDPHQKDKIMQTYLSSLGIDEVTLAALRKQLFKAGAAAGAYMTSERLVLRIIIRAARLLGREFTIKQAGKLVPIAGGLIGAGEDFAFARKAAGKLKSDYKRLYFETWHIA